jgi:predicted nucleic acid-binding protein
MILVDTSVWIDHLQRSDSSLQQLLRHDKVLCHPMVIGELAVGNFRQRAGILQRLTALPAAIAASHDETLRFITHHSLYGRGIGYIDAHLLAAVKLTPGCTLWTRDKRLREITESLHLDFRPTP